MTLTFQRSLNGADGLVLEPSAAAPRVEETAQLREQRQQAGSILVDLYRYLCEHAVRQPLLAPAVSVLRDAVVQHRARAQDPLRGPRAVYAAIQDVRRNDPSLPPL